MKPLNHRNVVKVYGLYLHQGHLGIVMELANKGALKSHLHDQNFLKDVPHQFSVLRDVAYGMMYLHENHLLHRDVKPHNVLLFKIPGQRIFLAKITDFGEARVFA